jgi:hypothetical protein
MVSSVLCGWTLTVDDSQFQRLPQRLHRRAPKHAIRF